MRILLDERKTIAELRKVYNDKVTFVLTIKSYPFVKEIVINGDYQSGLKKRRVPVKIGKKVDRAIAAYQEKLVAIWEKHQNKIRELVGFDDRETIEDVEKSIIAEDDVEKATRVTLAQVNQERNPRRRFILRQRYLDQNKNKLLKPEIDKMRRELEREAKKSFAEVYRIGKERAQVLTDQELDNTLTARDRKELKRKDEWNKEFVGGLTDDLWEEYELILGRRFDDPQELLDAIVGAEKKEKRRLPLFAAAVGSVLLAAGTTAAARAVREDPETGEITPDPIPDPEDGMPIGTAFDGGIWHTRHDNRVCPGCEENDAKWMTHEQFQDEAGTNQCLTRCRCVELFEFEDRPVSASKIWQGAPGASIRNWPRFKRSMPVGNITKEK